VTPHPTDEAHFVDDVVTRLMTRFPDLPPNAVRDTVNASWAEFTGRPIRDFVPVLVERTARERLAGRAVV